MGSNGISFNRSFWICTFGAILGIAGCTQIGTITGNGQGSGEAGTGSPQDGRDGSDGANGLNCWDLNGNGLGDSNEDINGDGIFSALDCQGPQGPPGPSGEHGPAGPPGPTGGTGGGGGGGSGSSLFDTVIDTFYSGPAQAAVDPLVNDAEIPDPTFGPGLGGPDKSVVFRAIIPASFSSGNDVSLRLFFNRSGPTLGCFVLNVTAIRGANGQSFSSYGDARWVRLNATGGGTSQLVVIDLPVNSATGLGFPSGLNAGDVLVFELSTRQDDGAVYRLLQAEIYASSGGSASLNGAHVFTDAADISCVDCSDGEFVRNFSIDADWDSGSAVNIVHETPGQLTLSHATPMHGSVWVTASTRGTVVRIDTETGDVLGEFWSAPNGRGRYPWRVAVDRNGLAWVANFDENGGGRGSVVRIAASDSGLCVDRNHNGVIDTSAGLGDIRNWSNVGGVDNTGGVTSAEDECIIDYVSIAGESAGALAVDGNDDLWAGGSTDFDFERINGAYGTIAVGSEFTSACGGYHAIFDLTGVLWVSSSDKFLFRYDPGSGTGTCIPIPGVSYGLAVDPQTGHVWNTSLFGNAVFELDSEGTIVNAYEHHNANAEGIVIDDAGNAWIANSTFGSTTVGHLLTDGTFVGEVPLAGSGGAGPTNVSIDKDGFVWVTNSDTDNAMRIDPSQGQPGNGGIPIGAVDTVVSLGFGAGPVNLGDMTGYLVRNAALSGSWTIVVDSETAGTPWLSVVFNKESCADPAVPDGTTLAVEVRAADALGDLPAATSSSPAANGSLDSVAGRYLQVRVSFTGSNSDQGPVTPVLCDLAVTASCGQ